VHGGAFSPLSNAKLSFGSYHTKFQPVGLGLSPSFHTTSLLSTSDTNSGLEKRERERERGETKENRETRKKRLGGSVGQGLLPHPVTPFQ
jgi:hypothetical protein